MLDATIISASGLQAASLQMQSAAQNMANAVSANYQPTTVALTTRADGGVSAQLVPAPATDLATQLVSQQEASFSERANLAVFGAAGRAYQSLLDMLR
jgi:hypothetical protein